MVSHVYQCPHCGQSERVVRRGFNRCGTQRLLCRECGKTWTPTGKSRELSREKEALIEKALGERLSQRAIARTLGVNRDTVRAVLKKSPRKAV
jgi:transposase-like protein